MRVPGESRAGKGSQPGPPRDSGRVPKGGENRLFQGSRRTGHHQGSPRPFQGPPEAQHKPKIVQKWNKHVQKSLPATPLQPAIETAVKQFVIAASLQPATETAVNKNRDSCALTAMLMKRALLTSLEICQHYYDSALSRGGIRVSVTRFVLNCFKALGPFLGTGPKQKSLR